MEAQSPTQFKPYARWVVLLVVIASFAILGAWTFGTPQSLTGKADAVGYAVCHRIPERSFQAYGQSLPLCARCTGIYLGVMVGFGMYAFTGRLKDRRLPHWKLLGVMALFVAWLAVDGVNSYFHLFPGFDDGLYQPNNTLRLTTGIYTGMTMITLVLPVFNGVVWEDGRDEPLLRSWKELAGLFLVGTMVLLAVLTRLPLPLIIFGVISSMGVVLVLTLINSVWVVTFLRRERQYRELSDLWLPLLAGVSMAFILIGSIDYVRFAITGTWSGFTFT